MTEQQGPSSGQVGKAGDKSQRSRKDLGGWRTRRGRPDAEKKRPVARMGFWASGDNVNMGDTTVTEDTGRPGQPLPPTWPVHTTGSNTADRKDTVERPTMGG